MFGHRCPHLLSLSNFQLFTFSHLGIKLDIKLGTVFPLIMPNIFATQTRKIFYFERCNIRGPKIQMVQIKR